MDQERRRAGRTQRRAPRGSPYLLRCSAHRRFSSAPLVYLCSARTGQGPPDVDCRTSSAGAAVRRRRPTTCVRTRTQRTTGGLLRLGSASSRRGRHHPLDPSHSGWAPTCRPASCIRSDLRRVRPRVAGPTAAAPHARARDEQALRLDILPLPGHRPLSTIRQSHVQATVASSGRPPLPQRCPDPASW